MAQPIALVPLDGSGAAEAVLPWAVTLARALGLRLTLARWALAKRSGGGAPDAARAAELTAARHYLTGVALDLKESGVTAETRAEPLDGKVEDDIVATAEALDVALIALATHGHTGPRRWLMGSVADAVVRTTARPVLVVRADPAVNMRAAHTLTRMVVTLDGSELAELALGQAVSLAQQTGATLDLVRVTPSIAMLAMAAGEGYFPVELENDLEESATSYLRDVMGRLPDGVAANAVVLRGPAADEILDYAEEHDVNLIIMSTHGRSGVVRWALGSIADKVLRAGNRPLLLLRAPAAE